MTKVKILALLVGVVLLLTIPATVLAQQPQLPHLFIGSAEGSEVTAWVDGEQVASGAITDGSYLITVDPGTEAWGGKTVSFQIDGVGAAETATFAHGAADELDLTPGAMMEATPEPTTVMEATPMAMATSVPGARGPSGPRGPAGAAGPAGSDGGTGAAGSAGSSGPAGPAGAEGDDGSNILGIIALILGIVAIIGAGGAFMLGRRT